MKVCWVPRGISGLLEERFGFVRHGAVNDTHGAANSDEKHEIGFSLLGVYMYICIYY